MMKVIPSLLAMLGLAASVSAALAASVLTPQDKDDITALISQLVWGGFETREAITQAAAEAVSPIAEKPADLDTGSANTNAWGKIGLIGPDRDGTYRIVITFR